MKGYLRVGRIESLLNRFGATLRSHHPRGGGLNKDPLLGETELDHLLIIKPRV